MSIVVLFSFMAWSPPALKRRKWLVKQARDYAATRFHHFRDGTQTFAVTLLAVAAGGGSSRAEGGLSVAERDSNQNSVDPPPELAPTPIIHGLAICRSGSAVQITITAGNEYLAIELFDRLAKSAQEGSLRLDINATAGGMSASAQH